MLFKHFVDKISLRVPLQSITHHFYPSVKCLETKYRLIDSNFSKLSGRTAISEKVMTIVRVGKSPGNLYAKCLGNDK